MNDEDMELWYRHAMLENVRKNYVSVNHMRLAMHGTQQNVSDQNVCYKYGMREYSKGIM